MKKYRIIFHLKNGSKAGAFGYWKDEKEVNDKLPFIIYELFKHDKNKSPTFEKIEIKEIKDIKV